MSGEGVGGSRPISVDVRIISATNCDLLAEAKRGRFREDLYFRLAGMTLRVPALRDRSEDIPLLAQAFLDRVGGGRALQVSDEAMARLCCYSWPGNVRELRNVVARAALLCDGEQIMPCHLILDGDPGECTIVNAPPSQKAHEEQALFPFHDSVAARQAIVNALESSGGNQTAAAKRLNISRRALVNRLEQYGLPRPRMRSGQI